ncbi:hypothetical protein TELCIR_05488, partial [Teladorsagia circumcincta]
MPPIICDKLPPANPMRVVAEIRKKSLGSEEGKWHGGRLVLWVLLDYALHHTRVELIVEGVVKIHLEEKVFETERHYLSMRVAADDANPKIVSKKLEEIANEPGGHETLLIRCITRFYGHWALFVANHAILTIVICTILTLIGTYKVITTPYVAGEFFSKGGSSISVFVLILPKDGGNVLREDVLKEAAE